jgi:hypothetical protein
MKLFLDHLRNTKTARSDPSNSPESAACVLTFGTRRLALKIASESKLPVVPGGLS